LKTNTLRTFTETTPFRPVQAGHTGTARHTLKSLKVVRDEYLTDCQPHAKKYPIRMTNLLAPVTVVLRVSALVSQRFSISDV
jgi:hypothetical protein